MAGALGLGGNPRDDVFKMSSPVKVYSISSETAIKNIKAVAVSSDKHRKVSWKDDYQSHPKHQSKVLQMPAVAGKYLLEAMSLTSM